MPSLRNRVACSNNWWNEVGNRSDTRGIWWLMLWGARKPGQYKKDYSNELKTARREPVSGVTRAMKGLAPFFFLPCKANIFWMAGVQAIVRWATGKRYCRRRHLFVKTLLLVRWATGNRLVTFYLPYINLITRGSFAQNRRKIMPFLFLPGNMDCLVYPGHHGKFVSSGCPFVFL